MSENESPVRPSRRDLLAGALTSAAVGAVVLSAPSLLIGSAYAGDAKKAGEPTRDGDARKDGDADKGGVIELKPLPYEDTALAPVISQNTISFHHGKHQKAYVDNANKNLAGNALAGQTLVEIIKATHGKADQAAIYNNVAQVWNHQFYWKSMRPKGGGAPTGRIADRIKSDLGGYDAFKQAFSKSAMGRFGSGWAWLVLDNGKLAIVDTPNAETPHAAGQKPLLVLDVWEHAYYLDYQNKRVDYVNAWLDNLVNWEFAEKNLD